MTRIPPRRPLQTLLLALGRFWLCCGLAVSSLATETYTVQRGDTLYSIAKAHGTSVAVLAEQNGLSHNYHVYIGQRLTLPDSGDTTPSGRRDGRFAIPDSVRRAIARARVQPGRWRYIVIHHSGVDSGTVAGMDRYHRRVRHMENGIAYHFVIGNGHGIKDGTIAVCPRWTEQLNGGHLASEAQNRVALGICLVGNFEKHKPTRKQLNSLVGLVCALMKRCHLGISAVKTHQQINVVYTRCPGRQFPLKTFMGMVKAATES
jgi:N-acetylmuramoyl-L-alanine amidase/LysM domain